MHRQSTQCKKCYLAKISRPENYITKTCPVCQNDFTVHVVHIKRGQGKYCSRSCARQGHPTRKRQRIRVECHTCHTEFEKRPCEIAKVVHGKHFCSAGCFYAYHRGESHVEWSGGQSERVNPQYRKWRKAVLERDKHHCRLCHVGNWRLEAHHIKRFSSCQASRWIVSNGITLCHDCHIMYTGCEEEYEDILQYIANIPLEIWTYDDE